MIQPPHRSVTRFFIPMIDVLTLLFCIFLLMPYVKTEASEAATPAQSVPPDTAQLAKEAEQLRGEVERLNRTREQALRRQVVCVLEIDANTGKLVHRGADRFEVADQAKAAELIGREMRAAGDREVYFLILYPRELSGFPEQRQVAAYERWFAGVPGGFDNPRGRKAGGGR